jgi:phosphate transport system substrate-binding protein
MLTLFWGQASAWASPSMQSTGSSFAAVAIQEWVGQTSTLYGLNINWQVQSSVVGLNDFAQQQVDFGASDIPYSSDQAQSTPSFPYQYLPDVAGGLSFMYNLNGNDGQRINSLVLNAQVIDKIFLGEITTWNDPAIAAINRQLQGDLPSTRIVPVYRTDASGENYLLSDYLLHQDGPNFTGAQNAFHSGGILGAGQPSANWPVPGPGASYNPQTYPGWAAGNPVPQSGSDNAANYVSSLSSQGSITYVETAYAKEHALPVASLLNKNGNGVQPTSLNVATALEAAILHPDLTQDLTNVYTNPLANAYPLSAYSYLVTPCSPALAAAQHTACAANNSAVSTFPSQKGKALGQFAAFMACAGQQQMATLGYSPLPPNLVQEDFDAIGRLNGGVQPPPASPSTCQNPYVDGQTPLPGEPPVQGQACPTCGVHLSGPSGPGGGGPGSGSPGGGGAGGISGSSGAGSSGAGSSGAGSSGAGGSSSGSGSTKGLTAGQIAAGYKVVNGHIVQSLNAGPTKFMRADALINASKGIDGIPLTKVLGWLLVAVVLFLGIPLLGTYWKRRAGHTPDQSEPEPEGTP